MGLTPITDPWPIIIPQPDYPRAAELSKFVNCVESAVWVFTFLSVSFSFLSFGRERDLALLWNGN